MTSEHLRVSPCKTAALQYLGERAEKAVFDWKWISRPLEIFSLLLDASMWENWEFSSFTWLASESCWKAKHNTAVTKSLEPISSWSLWCARGWAVLRQQQWHCLLGLHIASRHLRQILDEQFVLSLRALPCHVSTWTGARPGWKTATELGLMARPRNFKANAIKKSPPN